MEESSIQYFLESMDHLEDESCKMTQHQVALLLKGNGKILDDVQSLVWLNGEANSFLFKKIEFKLKQNIYVGKNKWIL